MMYRKLTAAALAFCLLLLTACSGGTASPAGEDRAVTAGLDIPAPADEGTAETGSLLSDIDLTLSTETVTFPALSHPSSEYNRDTALSLLGLCTGHTAEKTAQLFEDAGFSVILQANYETDDEPAAHTCAYTAGTRLSPEGRLQYLIVLRGTAGSEWYSNFDFAPSQREDTAFAENFLLAAENVFASFAPLIDFSSLPQIIVCGHSRGGACANLLGVLLDGCYDAGSVYTYTFACPATVRPAYFDKTYDNIFNIINPGDLVPRLPLAAWGYARAGTDIIPGGDEEAAGRADCVADVLAGLAPDIVSYYTVRHSLTEPGESEDGLTAFELMSLIGTVFTEASAEAGDDSPSAGSGSSDGVTGLISNDSDFAPLRDLIERALADGGSAASAVLTEHLPAAYAEILG